MFHDDLQMNQYNCKIMKSHQSVCVGFGGWVFWEGLFFVVVCLFGFFFFIKYSHLYLREGWKESM